MKVTPEANIAKYVGNFQRNLESVEILVHHDLDAEYHIKATFHRHGQVNGQKYSVVEDPTLIKITREDVLYLRTLFDRIEKLHLKPTDKFIMKERERMARQALYEINVED